MSKTDNTRPCKLKHAEGKPWWMPCCSWPSSHRLTKQRNRRGYGTQHQRVRTTLDIRVQAGLIDCVRCGRRILPGEPWHLDHDDNDRGRYLGPSHAFCNTSAGGKQAHTKPD